MTAIAAIRDAIARAEPAWVMLALAIYFYSSFQIPLVGYFESKRMVGAYRSALMLAAGLGYRDGNMAVPTRDRGTPQEAIAAIQLCLDHGAEINAAGDSGDTALHFSVTGRGDVEIIRYLVEHGAALQARNKKGQTPLEAARTGFRDRTAAVHLLENLPGH